MASLFNQDPNPGKPLGPYAPERIEREVAHLWQRSSSRRGPSEKAHRSRAGWWVALAVSVLLWLFFMDPFLHALHREEAIRDYLYLHHFGSEKKTSELLSTGIFTPNEIDLLNLRSGSFGNYYAGPGEGNRAADSIIGYMRGVSNLQKGDYDRLDWIGKIRYQLFVRFGLHPPTSWAVLDPSINH